MPDVLYLGSGEGTSRHRLEAFRRLKYNIFHIDPRSLLLNNGCVDKIEWHIAPEILSFIVFNRLKALLLRRRFDLVWVDNGSLISAKTVKLLNNIAGHVINYNHDDPFGGRDGVRFRSYLKSISFYDLMVVVRPENVVEAKNMGAKKIYKTFMSADEIAHAPLELSDQIRDAWRSDVSFVGTWMPERGPFLLELIKRNVPLTIYGGGWRKDPNWSILKKYHRFDNLTGSSYNYAIQCSRIALGLLSRGNRDRHTTRSVEIPYMGGILCAERTEDHLYMYEEGSEALFWSSAAECAEVCGKFLSDANGLKRISQNGMRRARRNGFTNESLISRSIGAL